MSIKKVVSITLILIAIISIVLFFTVSSNSVIGTPKLDYKILTPESILSGAYKVYGKEGLGLWGAKLIITNSGDAPAYNVKPVYTIEGYSNWAEGKLYPVILPGSTVVDLYYPILSNEVTKLTTSTPSKIKLKISYSDVADGVTKEISESKSISILEAHDFVFSGISAEQSTGSFADTFANYPLLAAWVTPSDPVLMKFADAGNKIAGGAAANLSDDEAIKSLKGMWDLSAANHIAYKTEPSAFWTGKFSQFIKYPRDVLKDKSGTCIDTALFFASLAMSQGLDAYIILMPGHAFPVVKLPISGDLLVIESTQLNAFASFEQALEVGEQTYYDAMKGPYLWIDIKSLQIKGITPPQLEDLPQDIFKQWDIKETIKLEPTVPDPQEGQTPSIGTVMDLTDLGLQVFQNDFPEWAITYPLGWTTQYTGDTEILLLAPNNEDEVLISWLANETKENMRAYVEAGIAVYGSITVVDVSQETVSGYVADVVNYDLYNTTYLVSGVGTGKYFSTGTYGFSVFYDTISSNTPVAMSELIDIVTTLVVSGD